MNLIKNNHTKTAFTQIELIAVIIIIGLLAMTAIPKLAATRDDASLAADVSNMAQCIMDASSTYTAQGVDISSGDSDSCDSVVCFDITYGTNGSNFKVETNPSADSFCGRVDDVGGHLARTYTFRGSRISI
jgi:type II secretory pathway pseudopilin PulG